RGPGRRARAAARQAGVDRQCGHSVGGPSYRRIVATHNRFGIVVRGEAMRLTDDPDLFEPLSRPSTPELLAERLREAITRGRLTPGRQLGEASLATQFEVSRGPLREAMQRLVAEGLLRSERHRGIFVVELTDDDVRDVYRARKTIERA